MNVGALRNRIGIILLSCGIVIGISYGLAGYLIFKRRQPASPAPPKVTQARGLAQLNASAEANLRNNRVEQALVDYREALSLNPKSLPAQLGLAQGEFLAGREDVAAREYERVLKLDPNNQTALLTLARIASHETASWPQSEASYRQYLKLNPADAQAALGLARVLVWRHKTGEAAEVFGRSDVAPLLTPADQRDYAFALVKLNRGAQAEPMLRKLLAARPDDTELKLQLAGIYAARKDWDKALPIYRELLAKKPNDPHLNLIYGLGLLSGKNYRAAVGPLGKARYAMPSSPEAGIAYARAIKGTSDLKKAVKEYERVQPLFPNNASIVREYADVLMEKRDYKHSAEQYARAYKMGLRDDRLLAGYAGALTARGKYKDAVPLMEELHRRKPTQRNTFELAKLMAKTGHNDRARELLRQVENSR